MYAKEGNSRMASKEKHEAKLAIDKHHAQGHHKRWAMAYPMEAAVEAVPAICRKAAAVQEKAHPGKSGVERAKKFLN
jgi:hypothetical protein